MKLNQIKETGFYKAVNDATPEYIYEVIDNTDEEWLKENPEAKLLIDEWGYEYTDNDERRHYETFGNLIQVRYADDIEVEKMPENFLISGDCGTHLTEDKLTYKQKYNNIINQIKEMCEQAIKNYDNEQFYDDDADIFMGESIMANRILNMILSKDKNSDK